MPVNNYTIYSTPRQPEMEGLWDGAVWGNITALPVDNFRPEGSDHPRTRCKLLYSPEKIYGIFRVDDRYVRCIHTVFQSAVYKDSCVEFFVQPKTTGGYFNFEFNCGGTLLASYITDPTRVAGGVKEFVLLAPEDNLMIKRYHNLPAVVEPEITGNIVWFLEFAIPLSLLEKYAGGLGKVSGQIWRGNCYKCGAETSHPHWGAWSAVNKLNFHLPECFGRLQFAPP